MTAALALGTAATFVWLGMVLAISFLEAPLKFRAPGVDLRIGLGIGRLVFRALNSVEAVLAAVLVISVLAGGAPARILIPAVISALLLVVQVAAVRPRLSRRSDRILPGHAAAPPPPSPPPAVISALLLVVQVAAVRPRLSRRSDRILPGQDAPRSRAHYAYVALEAARSEERRVG